MVLPLVLSTNELEVFSHNYSQAKHSLQSVWQNFVADGDSCSYVVENFTDQNNEALTTEIHWLGSESADKVLVLISATHGVEGFVGAAVQTDLLLRLQQAYSLPGDTAVLIVFALNPFGFVNHRRCDEMGVDLNRNFIDFDQPVPVNQGYLRIKNVLYIGDIQQRQKKLDEFRQQVGQVAYEVAISGGQYCDPDGAFYGGLNPAHGHNVIDQLIQRYQLASRNLAVIDIHSGLGPYAYGEVISDHPLDSSGYRLANKWYGACVTSPLAGSSSSVKKLGLLDYRWHELMQHRGCFITLEFGSYGTDSLFNVILEDHRSWKSADQQAISNSAKAMREHFCPQDTYWRELVLVKARQVIQQALDGLENE